MVAQQAAAKDSQEGGKICTSRVSAGGLIHRSALIITAELNEVPESKAALME